MIRLTGHLGAVFVLCLACGFRTVPASAEEGALVIDDYVPCGQVSLYAVCRLNGLDVEWEQVKELVGPTHDGGMHSFSDIASAGLELGLYPTAVHCTPDVLRTLPMPGIVHLTQARASAPLGPKISWQDPVSGQTK